MFRYYEQDPQTLARVLIERARQRFCALIFTEFGEGPTPSKTAEANEANLIAECVKSDLAACKTDAELKQVIRFWMEVIRHRLAMDDESSSVVTTWCTLDQFLYGSPIDIFDDIRDELAEVKNLFPRFWDNNEMNRYCNRIRDHNFAEQTKILNVMPFLTHLSLIKGRTKMANQAPGENTALHLSAMNSSFCKFQEHWRGLEFATKPELASFESALARQKKLPPFSQIKLKVYNLYTVGVFGDDVELAQDIDEASNPDSEENRNIFRCFRTGWSPDSRMYLMYLLDFSSVEEHLPLIKTQFIAAQEIISTAKNFHLRIQVKIKDELLKEVIPVLEALQRSLFNAWDPKRNADFSLVVTDEDSKILQDFFDTGYETERFNRISSTIGWMNFLTYRELGLPLGQPNHYLAAADPSGAENTQLPSSMDVLSLN